MTEQVVTQSYERYGHLVLRRCRRVLRDATLAEDAMQETFYRLWRYGDSFLVADSPVAWLTRVADRCCFDALAERRTVERTAEATLRAQDTATTSEAPPDAQLAERQAVLRTLERFEPRVQQLAILHYVGELNQDEIAEATGWSRQTVNKKLGLLRDRFRRLHGLQELS